MDEEQIRLYLDMGAMGIMTAMVNTAEQAEEGARSCRYPPRGKRGFGPHRASRYGYSTEDYLNEIDNQVLFIPMIESAEAVENIDAILAVPDVDTFVLGPVDLSYSLGVPFDYESAAYREAESVMLAAAQRAGIPAGGGLYGSPLEIEPLNEAIDKGYRAVLLGGDEFLLTAACQSVMDNVRKARDR